MTPRPIRRRGRYPLELAAVLTAFVAAGCTGNQSSFNSAGPQAARIEGLWWLFFWVSVGVYVISMGFLLLPMWRKRRTARRDAPDAPVVLPEPASERKLTIAAGTGVVLTVVILFVLLFGDFFTGRALHSFASAPDPLSIKLTAHQWWWEVQYNDSTPSNIVITANEIHIPVGKPVRIDLTSNDVIHSFWVPNLHGKKDMIPGHQTSIYLQADRSGTYNGQCAEFCGYQHAKMRLFVIAEPEERFNAWLAAERQPASDPTEELPRRGQQVFLSSTCIMCHTIRGTHAGSRVGPELTHLAGRQTIAGGSLPNVRGHLAGWILDPQKIKPGVRMPQNPLEANDLHALLEYLSGLK
jgi:cytochrome c oxidase subunit II